MESPTEVRRISKWPLLLLKVGYRRLQAPWESDFLLDFLKSGSTALVVTVGRKGKTSFGQIHLLIYSIFPSRAKIVRDRNQINISTLRDPWKAMKTFFLQLTILTRGQREQELYKELEKELYMCTTTTRSCTRSCIRKKREGETGQWAHLLTPLPVTHTHWYTLWIVIDAQE